MAVTNASAAIADRHAQSPPLPGAVDRGHYCHPVETLAFFGLTPTMTVLYIEPFLPTYEKRRLGREEGLGRG